MRRKYPARKVITFGVRDGSRANQAFDANSVAVIVWRGLGGLGIAGLRDLADAIPGVAGLVWETETATISESMPLRMRLTI